MFNWVTLLIGVAGIYIGYKLNQYANKQSENRIIAAFKAEIESLKNKQSVGRLSLEDTQKINILEQTIERLQNK